MTNWDVHCIDCRDEGLEHSGGKGERTASILSIIFVSSFSDLEFLLAISQEIGVLYHTALFFPNSVF